MIIKGLIKRYERWNPVHPTLGTFWGMGIGVGCGVGWGPGFGPEVIGYVGAGCGAGFSIGITLAGVGIGLPQNGPIIKASQSAYAAANVYLESARALGVAILNGMVWDSINMFSPQINSLRKQSSKQLSKFRDNAIRVTKKIEFTNLNKALSGSMQSTLECLRAFRDQQCENAIRATEKIEFTNLNKALSASMQSSLECWRAFRDQHWPPPNGK